MNAEDSAPVRDETIHRRRQILYASAGVALLLIAVFTLPALLKSDKKPERAPKLSPPLIVERIQMKPVAGASGRGLAEVLRRGSAESVRVLAARLTPSRRNQAYQLVLVGGGAAEKLLGTEIVGKEGLFVGEAKLPLTTLRGYRRIELRRVTNADQPTSKTVLRGSIPR